MVEPRNDFKCTNVNNEDESLNCGKQFHVVEGGQIKCPFCGGKGAIRLAEKEVKTAAKTVAPATKAATEDDKTE